MKNNRVMKNSRLVKQALTLFLVLVSLYIFIWIGFSIKGPFYVGDELVKSDWLSFLAGFLSFVGTVIISIIVIIQNKNYKEMDNERLRLQNLPSLKFRRADLYNDNEFKFESIKELKERTRNPINQNQLINSPYKDSDSIICIYNCPLILWKDEKFQIKSMVDSRSIVLEAHINQRGIFKTQNYGIGTAINLSVKVKSKLNDPDETPLYDFGGLHLKEQESIYYEIDVLSLKNEKLKDIILEFSYSDIFGNQYTQGALFNFKTEGSKFEFKLVKTDEAPILKRSFKISIL